MLRNRKEWKRTGTKDVVFCSNGCCNYHDTFEQRAWNKEFIYYSWLMDMKGIITFCRITCSMKCFISSINESNSAFKRFGTLLWPSAFTLNAINSTVLRMMTQERHCKAESIETRLGEGEWDKEKQKLVSSVLACVLISKNALGWVGIGHEGYVTENR